MCKITLSANSDSESRKIISKCRLIQKKLINIEENPDSALMLATELFHSGKIFIYPTDTIYGLVEIRLMKMLLKESLKLKEEMKKNSLSGFFSDFENVMNYTEIIFENHLDFLQKIWPAPVTVILNLNERTKEITNQETAAIRIPQNDFCLKLLKEISRPLISTSVNRSGNDPVTQIEQIISDFSAGC